MPPTATKGWILGLAVLLLAVAGLALLLADAGDSGGSVHGTRIAVTEEPQGRDPAELPTPKSAGDEGSTPGSGRTALPVDAPEPAAAPPSEAAGPPGGWGLCVRPVDPTGQALAPGELERARIDVIDRDGGFHPLDRDGDRFRGRDLTAGSAWIQGSVPGFHAATIEVLLEPEGPPQEFDLPLTSLTRLVVRAVRGEEPAFESPRGGYVQVGRGRLTAVLTETAPGANLPDFMPGGGLGLGTMRPPVADEARRGVVGVLSTHRAPPYHVSLVLQRHVVATRFVHEPVEEVVFEITGTSLEDPAELRGLIRYRPVDAATGEVLRPEFQLLAIALSSWAFGEGEGAGHGGWIEHDDIPPGKVQLTAVVPGYERMRLQVDVGPGEWVDLGDVPLAPRVPITGVVVDAANRPVLASVRYEVLDWSPPRRVQEVFSHTVAQTDGEGRFELDAGPHRFRVWARARTGRGRSANVVVDARGGRVDGLVIPCVAPGKVLLQDPHRKWVGQRLRILDPDGHPVHAETVPGTMPWTVDLFPGSLTLEILDADGGVDERIPLEVPAPPLDVEDPPPGLRVVF